MTSSTRLVAAFAVASLPFVSVVAAQEHPVMPPGMTHEQHMALMKQQGQMAMGFD
jgi:hypothetical protein